MANHRKNDKSSSKKPKASASTNVKQNNNNKLPGMTRTIEPFSLILPKNQVCKTLSAEKENNVEKSYEVLRSGMIILKNYLSLSEQVEIVNICEEVGIGPGGFGQPGYEDGRKLQLQMLCLGRYWDPQTRYSKGYGFKVPQIPDKFISLVETALQDSQTFINSEDELPWMSPNIGIVNFYTATGRLGIHQDRDESWESISKGSPVVSISIGDSAEFLYGDKRDVDKLDKVVLESGDILIFGGKSRNIYHGVKAIIPNSAPEALLKESMLRPGCLNLTFRKY
ncbi:oxoglutarate/iron-dependent dioxygenase [Tanacetum coccineum]